MQVFITIDTECSEERMTRWGVRPPLGYDSMIWGRFANCDDELGLGFLLSELAHHGFAATFFLEALCAEVFGMAGLARICERLGKAGQDVQLHLHPNMRRPTWRSSGGEPLPDNIGEYALAAQVALLRDGLNVLEAAGVPRAGILAFRAGNYGASNLTWSALRAVGLVLDSSLNLCYLNRDCMIQPDRPRIDLYAVGEGLWELPVTCFRVGNGFRHLETTAISFPEMVHALDALERFGFECATIVTHPGEFFVVDDLAGTRGRRNSINVSRFRKLLQFLDRERHRFQVTTVGDLSSRLAGGLTVAAGAIKPIPYGPRYLRAGRVPVQLWKRLLTYPRG